MTKELTTPIMTMTDLPKPDLTIVTPLSVTHNMVAIKATITAIIDGIKKTDYDDAGAKTVKADLNKARDVVKKTAAQFKADCMKPIDDILADFKTIDGMFVGAYEALDAQVKASVACWKESRQKEIDAIFAEELANRGDGFTNLDLGEIPDWINLASVQQPDWLNKGTTNKYLHKVIGDHLDRVLSEYGTIQAMPEGDRAIVLETYTKGLNLASGLDALARFKRQQEAATADKIPQTPPPPAMPTPAPSAPIARTSVASANEPLTGSLSVGKGSFSVTGTRGNISVWIKSAASLGVTLSKVEG